VDDGAAAGAVSADAEACGVFADEGAADWGGEEVSLRWTDGDGGWVCFGAGWAVMKEIEVRA
jgi:hypothetical protein